MKNVFTSMSQKTEKGFASLADAFNNLAKVLTPTPK
jgi:hypothetical protein